MQPPFPYYGGKQRIASQIIALMPKHSHYIEPFFGGGSILFAKEVAAKEKINDLDGRVVNFWRMLRDAGAELERVCALTPHSRDEQASSYEISSDSLEDARRFFVMLTQGRNARLTRSGWRNIIDPANSMNFNGYISGYLKRFAPAIERLANVSIESQDALKVIESYGRYSDNLLYCDPPYLGESRNSRGYTLEEAGIEFHERFLSAVKSVHSSVVVSGYSTPIYEDALSEWHRYEIRAKTNTALKTEIVWVKG